MNRILTFLLKYIAVFVFIVLELIALTFYFNSNTFQRSKFFQFTSSTVANIQTKMSCLSDYFALRGINDKLSEENAELRTNLDELKFRMIEDKMDTSFLTSIEPKMKYVKAKIVSNTVNRFQNYIIIDKGILDGIEEDMGVICSDGVVGVVQSVTNNFSVVMPIINVEQRISVKIKSNNQLGSLVWDGKNPQYAIMEDIPGHVDPIIGDTIITSGYSSIFPKGVLLGTIDNIKGGDDINNPFKEVAVKLSVDYYRIEYVMVTKYVNKKELLELKKNLISN